MFNIYNHKCYQIPCKTRDEFIEKSRVLLKLGFVYTTKRHKNVESMLKIYRNDFRCIIIGYDDDCSRVLYSYCQEFYEIDDRFEIISLEKFLTLDY